MGRDQSARGRPVTLQGRSNGSRMAASFTREPAMSNAASDPPRYQRFGDFYPVYLSEHANRTSRRLHFAGSSLALVCLAGFVATINPLWLLAALVCGYGFAWVGHFFFEHNRPATFRQPLYSLMGDWKMYWQTLTGRIPF
jgi:hypothetical protein